jgi:hypothetical protein
MEGRERSIKKAWKERDNRNGRKRKKYKESMERKRQLGESIKTKGAWESQAKSASCDTVHVFLSPPVTRKKSGEQGWQ